MNIVDLPFEVLMLIFEFVDGNDKIMLNRTCRAFKEIMKEKRLAR